MTPQAALEAINAYYDQSEPNVEAPDESIFEIAGITGVTHSNLISIDSALRTDGSSPWTVSDIQTIVNEVREGLALTAIREYFDMPLSTPMPDETIFADAGITGVTADNLDDVLAALEWASDELPTTFSFSKDEIQGVVNSVVLPI